MQGFKKNNMNQPNKMQLAKKQDIITDILRSHSYSDDEVKNEYLDELVKESESLFFKILNFDQNLKEKKEEIRSQKLLTTIVSNYVLICSLIKSGNNLS
jgi:hypothetical protein